MDMKLDELNFYIDEYLHQIKQDIEVNETELSKCSDPALCMYYSGLLNSSKLEYRHLSRLKEVMV